MSDFGSRRGSAYGGRKSAAGRGGRFGGFKKARRGRGGSSSFGSPRRGRKYKARGGDNRRGEGLTRSAGRDPGSSFEDGYQAGLAHAIRIGYRL